MKKKSNNRQLIVTTRHKRTNRRLRYFFVMSGMLLLVALIVAPTLRRELLFTPIEIPRTNIAQPDQFRISDASFAGHDNNNNPFTMQAKTARQEFNDSDRIFVEQIHATMIQVDGIKNDIRATHGVYTKSKNEIKLTGNVTVKSSDGNTLQTHELVILVKGSMDLMPTTRGK